MHLFTITIHTHLFGNELDEYTLECMAHEYLHEFNLLLKKHNLDKDFSVEAYWTRGSLIEHFMLILENTQLAGIFSAGLAYKTLKEYEDIRKNVILLASDVKKISLTIMGRKVYTDKSLISETKPPKKAKKVKTSKPKPSKDEDTL